jgi:hypothetical protein
MLGLTQKTLVVEGKSSGSYTVILDVSPSSVDHGEKSNKPEGDDYIRKGSDGKTKIEAFVASGRKDTYTVPGDAKIQSVDGSVSTKLKDSVVTPLGYILGILGILVGGGGTFALLFNGEGG